jgi:hypothetical protein
MKKGNIILGLGLLGIGYYIWRASKKPKFVDKELEKLVEDTQKIPDVKIESGVPVVEGNASWIDTRPNYDMACFPKNWKDALSMPECKDYFHIANAHLIEKGTIKIPDVTSLTKAEFESMGNLDLIMVDGQIMPKGYYVDFVLKPDPTVIAEEVQRKLDEYHASIGMGWYVAQEDSWGIKKGALVFGPLPTAQVSVPVQSPSDPLIPVASQEYISKYDPDNVLPRIRLGIDVGYTGVRQPQVTYTQVGSAYSNVKMVDGVLMGTPIEGAKLTYTIVANDGLGTVLYRNEYIMKNGVLTPVSSASFTGNQNIFSIQNTNW